MMKIGYEIQAELWGKWDGGKRKIGRHTDLGFLWGGMNVGVQVLEYMILKRKKG